MSINMEDLQSSLTQYNEQLQMVKQALEATRDQDERESLSTLQSELQELINLTEESIHAKSSEDNGTTLNNAAVTSASNEIDDEYALFMQEMEKSGAYECNNKEASQDSREINQNEDSNSSDIEEELSSLLGMKCAVYHTHKWGGQPTLHNAMVSLVVPRQDNDQFSDLQVQVLFTHPTHAEMLPCPYFLNGECKFPDEQCRYSHGSNVQLSSLKEAIEPDFNSLKVGSRILLKLNPTDSEDISIVKTSTEKYYLWHTGIIRHIDFGKRTCIATLEHGVKLGEKRKSFPDEYHVKFEEIFPLNSNNDESSSDSDISDTEYPDQKTSRMGSESDQRMSLIEKSFQNNAPAMGGWEQHTRGMGSKIMLAMGYVPGTGLGAASDGRLQPVEAHAMPSVRSLDHAMAISGKQAQKDPLKVEKKLKRLQKREEDRNKRAYEREKDKEKRNVFNFLNKTLGDRPEKPVVSKHVLPIEIKQSTSKDLNIEQFKVAENCKRTELEITKLGSSLGKYPQGSPGYRNIKQQLNEKNQELCILRQKEQQIAKEQKQRKDKQKMIVF